MLSVLVSRLPVPYRTPSPVPADAPDHVDSYERNAWPAAVARKIFAFVRLWEHHHEHLFGMTPPVSERPAARDLPRVVRELRADDYLVRHAANGCQTCVDVLAAAYGAEHARERVRIHVRLHGPAAAVMRPWVPTSGPGRP